MGILQNILKTINSAIDNIDFSPYQLISNKSTDGTLADNSDTKYPSQKAVKTYADTKETQTNKNQASGYLGLDENGQFSLTRQAMGKEIIDYKSLMNIAERKTTFTASDLFLASATSGNVYAVNRDVYFDSNFNSSSTKFDRPCLFANASVVNSGAKIIYNTGAIFLNNSLKMLVDVSIVPNVITPSNDHAFYLGLSTLPAVTLTTFTGTGLTFKYRPSENSGNIQILKVLSNNISTLLNTNIPFPNYSLTRFRILYDKVLDTAYFYINNTLVHTESSVLLVTTSGYYSFQYLYQGASSDSKTKWYGIFDHMIGVQNLP